jgi:hypothetical protein
MTKILTLMFDPAGAAHFFSGTGGKTAPRRDSRRQSRVS